MLRLRFPYERRSVRRFFLSLVVVVVLAAPAAADAHGIHSGNWHGTRVTDGNCTITAWIARNANPSYIQSLTDAACNSNVVNVAGWGRVRDYASGQIIRSQPCGGNRCIASIPLFVYGWWAYTEGAVCRFPKATPHSGQRCTVVESPVV